MRRIRLRAALCRIAAVFLTLTPGFASGQVTATLDAVDVQQVGRELLAARDGNAATRIRLESGERVVSLESRGVVGAVLTDRRFLCVTVASSGWQEARLRREDAAPEGIQLAANLALVITPTRIFGCDGPSGRVRITRLASREVVLEQGVNERVGVVVTDRRAIGFAAGFPTPADRSLQIGETLESLRVLARTANVRTSRRLLVFNAASALWTEEDLPLR